MKYINNTFNQLCKGKVIILPECKCSAVFFLICLLSWQPSVLDTIHLVVENPGEVGLTYIFLVQVWLRTEVLCTPSSTQSGFELMTSRSWQHIPCHWDACSNHLAIKNFLQVILFLSQCLFQHNRTRRCFFAEIMVSCKMDKYTSERHDVGNWYEALRQMYFLIIIRSVICLYGWISHSLSPSCGSFITGNTKKLDGALREQRHPWPRQIIKPQSFWIITCTSIRISYNYYSGGLFCSFTHLRTPRLPPKFHHLFILLPRTHNISPQSVNNISSKVAYRQTKQRYRKHNLLCQRGND